MRITIPKNRQISGMTETDQFEEWELTVECVITVTSKARQLSQSMVGCTTRARVNLKLTRLLRTTRQAEIGLGSGAIADASFVVWDRIIVSRLVDRQQKTESARSVRSSTCAADDRTGRASTPLYDRFYLRHRTRRDPWRVFGALLTDSRWRTNRR